tara:strand:+ start:423 stop:650 length:228 start_codon:yes stop_codon:yes gene_type:complete
LLQKEVIMCYKEKKMEERQILLINDYLNHLRGKLVRFILEENDMLAIHNLMEVITDLKLVYNKETKMYEASENEK